LLSSHDGGKGSNSNSDGAGSEGLGGGLGAFVFLAYNGESGDMSSFSWPLIWNEVHCAFSVAVLLWLTGGVIGGSGGEHFHTSEPGLVVRTLSIWYDGEGQDSSVNTVSVGKPFNNRENSFKRCIWVVGNLIEVGVGTSGLTSAVGGLGTFCQ